MVEEVVEGGCRLEEEGHYSQDHNHTQEYHTQAGTGYYVGIQVCSSEDKEVELLLLVCNGHKD